MIDQLLRIKQLREQRAGTLLHTARSAERSAAAAHDAARNGVVAYAASRAEQEATIFAGLRGTEVPGLRVRAAGAALTALQARAVALDRVARIAADARAEREAATAAATRLHAAALRGCAGVEALRERLAADRAAEGERAAEAEAEEAILR